MRRAALIAALALAGCGGGSGDSATRLLDRGFATDVDTGFLRLDAEAELEGGPFEGRLRVELEGPFRIAAGPAGMPDIDMAFRVTGAGRVHEGRAILTPANAWVEYGGATYEVGGALWRRLRDGFEQRGAGDVWTFTEAGIDPLDWVTGAEESGEEELGGTRATKVSGALDVEAFLRDLRQAPGGEEIPEAAVRGADEVVDDVEFDAWVGDDDVWRRISAETEFRVPEEEQDASGGLEAGRLRLDARLDDPNEPVEIERPRDARPLDELLGRLGIPPEALLGPGFAEPEPG